MKKILFFWLFSPLLLIGCGVQNTPQDSFETPSRAVSVNGIIEKKPLNIFEDGTHYLVEQNGKKTLLKSSFLDLSDFEDRSVTITGEQKEREDSPIHVFQIDVERAPLDDRPARYTEGDFLFSAEFPASWSRTLKNGVLGFAPQNSNPVITISREENSPEIRKKLSAGQSISVGKKSATKWEDGEQLDVFIPESKKNMLLQFHFSPQRDPDLEKLVFFEMLSGLEWLQAEEITKSPQEKEVLGEVIFCGGVAKKLCPTGFRCDLESFEPGASGVCIDAKTPSKEIESTFDAILQESLLESEGDLFDSQEQDNSVPENFLEYENVRFEYRFSIPKSWHWQHLGSIGDAVSLLQISEEEGGDPVVDIQIKNGTETAGIFQKNEKTIVVKNRDSSTYFEISGPQSFSLEIQNIANSLSF